MPATPALFPRVDAATYFKEKDIAMTEENSAPAPVDLTGSRSKTQKVRLRTAKILAADQSNKP